MKPVVLCTLISTLQVGTAFLQSRITGFRYPMPWPLGSSMAEKVLENPKWPPEWPYSEADFRRMDESDDKLFYNQPRLCYHIDDAAVGALTKFYAGNILTKTF